MIPKTTALLLLSLPLLASCGHEHVEEPRPQKQTAPASALRLKEPRKPVRAQTVRALRTDTPSISPPKAVTPKEPDAPGHTLFCEVQEILPIVETVELLVTGFTLVRSAVTANVPMFAGTLLVTALLPDELSSAGIATGLLGLVVCDECKQGLEARLARH